MATAIRSTAKPQPSRVDREGGIITRAITPWFPIGTSAAKAIADRELFVPDGYVLEVVHEWEDDEGFRVKFEFKTVLTPVGRASLPPAIGARLEDAEFALLTPQWDVIDRATPTNIANFMKRSSAKTVCRDLDYGDTVFIGDTQFGYRNSSGVWVTFHDERAVELALALIRAIKPKRVVIVGDLIDLPSESRHPKEPGFARSTQRALNATHLFLAQLRLAVGWDTEIIIIEGNHDKRIENMIVLNAESAYGITRANSPDEFPVMSLQYLLRLEELDIQYEDGWPGATFRGIPGMIAKHGEKSNGKLPAGGMYLSEAPHISLVHGHDHKASLMFRTVQDASGQMLETFVASPGALCKRDGEVPSYHGSLRTKGAATKIVENWQPGLVIVREFASGELHPSLIVFRNGKGEDERRLTAVYNGKRFVSNLSYEEREIRAAEEAARRKAAKVTSITDKIAKRKAVAA